MIWFVIERYVHCLTGITYIRAHHPNDNTNLDAQLDEHKAYKTFEPTNFNLSKHELNGLRYLYDFLNGLNESKRNVPKEIIQSDILFLTFKVV